MENNSAKSNTVHLLYKNLGETPNQCVTRFKLKNPEFKDVPMTYAGRLDPLAEGLLLVLSNGAILEKENYLNLDKTYEFELLWGFKTDTLDVLGLVETKEISIPTTTEVKRAVGEKLGKFEQKYPMFSSKPVNGKPLFMWAKEGKIKEVEIPSHEVEIYKIEHLSRRSISGLELLDEVKTKIKLVVGDFRQKEILSKWMEILLNSGDKEYVIDKISMTASGGFYVRQFVSDFAESFDAIATTFHIKRTEVGDFKVEDSVK